MLDRQDLEMIRTIMKEEIGASEERMIGRIAESEEHMGKRMDETEERMIGRIADSEERMGKRMDETEERMIGRIAESEERMDSRMDVRIRESEERILACVDARMDARFTASENLILGELDRVQMNLQSQLDSMKEKLEELTEYYRIKKLDDINDALLLQMIQKLEQRVEELERKTA